MESYARPRTGLCFGNRRARHRARGSGYRADIVLTATSSPQPALLGRWLKDTALVIAIGAVTPDRRELDDEAMRGSVIVESRDAALQEPGDIVMSGVKVTAEIGELLSGSHVPANHRPIIFKSVGIAAEDIAAAQLVYSKTLDQRWPSSAKFGSN